MTLRYSGDVAAADWIARAPVSVWRLLGFGPPGFPAYARLRYIPDPTRPGQDEADADVPDDHPDDMTQMRRALGRLGGFTGTPEDCYFCLWEGYSDVHVPPAVLDWPLVTVPYRRYFLLRGSLGDLGGWEEALGGGGHPPAFAWPADHAWCVASDVDPHWAGIGAGRAAIGALVDAPELDVVPARPADPQPTYY